MFDGKYSPKQLTALFIATVSAYVLMSPHIYGYGGGDHKNQLVLVKHTLNGAYLANDWYVNAGTAVTSPRFYYNYLIAIPGQLIGLPATFHILYILVSIGVLWSIYLLISEVFNDELTGVVVCGILLMGKVSIPVTPPFPPFISLAGKQWFPTLLKPSYAALPILIFGVLYLIREKFYRGFILLGVATLIHPTTGFWVAGMAVASIIATIILYENDAQSAKEYLMRYPWKESLSYAVVSSAIVIPLLAVTIYSNAGFEATYLNAWIRHRFHHIASSWEPVNVVSTFFISSTLFVGLIKYRKKYIPDAKYRTFVLAFVLVGVIIMFAGYIFTEIYPVSLIINLQPFRMENFVYLILFGALSKSIVKFLKSVHSNYEISRISYNSFPIVVLIIIIIVGSAGWGAAFVVSDTSEYNVQWVKTPGNGHPPEDSDFTGVYQNIERTTPKDAVFLIPPSHGRFRLGTSRAAVVTWKQFPFQSEDILEWRDRIEDVCQMDIEEYREKRSCSENYNSLAEEDIRNLGEKYNAQYVLTKNESHEFNHVTTAGEYHVYKITY
jgi:hypothetical protein